MSAIMKNYTRRTRGAVKEIEAALANGQKVMAKAGNWFRVTAFREEITPEGHTIWYATGTPGGHLSGSPGRAPERMVTTVSVYCYTSRLEPARTDTGDRKPVTPWPSNPR